MHPDVIIADEATAELDAESQRLVMALLEVEAASGVTLVIATHDLVLADACSRSYLLELGRLQPGDSVGVR